MIVTDERVARFISEKLGVSLCPPFTTMGLERDGQIVAGVLLNAYEPPNIHVTIAGTGWTRAFIKAVGSYVFRQLGCTRMTITTRNLTVARYAERLGGEVEGRLRDYYGEGEDAVIAGITKRDWRFPI